MARNKKALKELKIELPNTKNMWDNKSIDQKREWELFEKLRKNPDDNEAREEIVYSNLWLVRSLAKRMYESYPVDRAVVSIEDLRNDGVLGLLTAIKKYNHRKKLKRGGEEKRRARFHTYAFYWVKSAMQVTLKKNSMQTGISPEIQERIREFLEAQSALAQKKGRPPTIKEISGLAGISPIRAREIQTAISSATPISLDAPLNQGKDGRTLLDLRIDSGQKTLEEEAEESALKELVRVALATLNPRERKIISSRFGLGGAEKQTLEDTGRMYGICKERVRQIEKDGLNKLRSIHARRMLQDFA